MPTVREGIQPIAVFPAPKGKNKVQRVSVFPAEHWEKWGGSPGMYRLMLGEVWVTLPGERHSFFTPQGYREYLANWAALAVGLDVHEAERPNLCAGQPIRIFPDPASKRLTFGCKRAYAGSDPIHCADGQWRILVNRQLVSCDLVQGLDHLGQPMPG